MTKPSKYYSNRDELLSENSKQIEEMTIARDELRQRLSDVEKNLKSLNKERRRLSQQALDEYLADLGLQYGDKILCGYRQGEQKDDVPYLSLIYREGDIPVVGTLTKPYNNPDDDTWNIQVSFFADLIDEEYLEGCVLPITPEQLAKVKKFDNRSVELPDNIYVLCDTHDAQGYRISPKIIEIGIFDCSNIFNFPYKDYMSMSVLQNVPKILQEGQKNFEWCYAHRPIGTHKNWYDCFIVSLRKYKEATNTDNRERIQEANDLYKDDDTIINTPMMSM